MPRNDFTVLFDLDGTLLNTLNDMADAVNETMKALGHPGKTDAEVLAAIGNGIKRAIVAVLPAGADDGEIETALEIFYAQYAKCYMTKTLPYPGIVKLLRGLRGEGFKIAVISNKADAFTTGLVNKHFAGLADAAMGERPGIPLKPNPDAVFAALSQVGGVPERAVYIGDSEVDVATARNAGLPCILVSWGFRSRGVLLRAGADPASIADSAEEVLSKIRALAADPAVTAVPEVPAITAVPAVPTVITELAVSDMALAPAVTAVPTVTEASVAPAVSPVSTAHVSSAVQAMRASGKTAEKTLYISDLDGTLFDGGARISEYTELEINRLIMQGMHFSVATARSPASTFQLIAPLRVNAPIIMMNGVLVYDMTGKRYIKVEHIDPAAALGVASSMEDHGLHGFMYALSGDILNTYYTNLDPEPLRMFYEERTRLFNKRFVKTESFERAINSGERIVYFMLRGAENELKPAYDMFAKILGVDAIICEDNYAEGLCFLECFSLEASKRAAVRFLREYGGYERVVGFGDNLNDLPLFLECDECYAPENAKPEVKAAATAIIGSNDDDGVARWLSGRFAD